MNNGPRRSLRDSSQPVTIHSVGLTNFSNSPSNSSVARPLAFAGSEIPDGAAVKSSYLSNRVELGIGAPLLDRPVVFSAEPSQLVHFTHAQPGDGAKFFHALNNHSQRYVTESTPVVKLSQSTRVDCSGTVRPISTFKERIDWILANRPLFRGSVSRLSIAAGMSVYSREAKPRLFACILTVSGPEAAAALRAASESLAGETTARRKRTLGRR